MTAEERMNHDPSYSAPELQREPLPGFVSDRGCYILRGGHGPGGVANGHWSQLPRPHLAWAALVQSSNVGSSTPAIYISSWSKWEESSSP